MFNLELILGIQNNTVLTVVYIQRDVIPRFSSVSPQLFLSESGDLCPVYQTISLFPFDSKQWKHFLLDL